MAGTDLELRTMQFHEDTLDYVDHPEFGRLASLARLCEGVGIRGYSSQLEKLRGKPWATVRLIRMVAADGKSREMAMVDQQTVITWLSQINESRVDPAIWPRLRLYQQECAKALFAYWTQGAAVNPRIGEALAANEPTRLYDSLVADLIHRASVLEGVSVTADTFRIEKFVAAEGSRALPVADSQPGPPQDSTGHLNFHRKLGTAWVVATTNPGVKRGDVLEVTRRDQSIMRKPVERFLEAQEYRSTWFNGTVYLWSVMSEPEPPEQADPWRPS